MTLPTLIQGLIVVLLLVGIVALVRLWSLLGVTRTLVINLEATRQEATETLKRLDTTVAAAEQLMLEEVTPTLQAARATLRYVEVTSHALAETTSSLRRMTGKAETAAGATRLLTAGGTLAQLWMGRKTPQRLAAADGRRGSWLSVAAALFRKK